MNKLLFLATLIPLLMLAPSLSYADTRTDKLLKKLVDLQKTQIALNQDNTSVITQRLNTQNVYLNNIMANLQILIHANTVSINGTQVK